MSGDVYTDKQIIVDVLKSWEDLLSDGYQHYSHDVNKSLEKIADEILKNINNKSQ